MNLKIFLAISLIFPMTAMAVDRSGTSTTDTGRVGVYRPTQAAARMPSMVVSGGGSVTSTGNTSVKLPPVTKPNVTDPGTNEPKPKPEPEPETPDSANCRQAYRDCMDEFCLLDESQGYRCACSANIDQSWALIQEIQKIQSEADDLYTEGVEREQLGARVDLVFKKEQSVKQLRATSLSFAEWIGGVSTDVSAESGTIGNSLDYDEVLGEDLYLMAANYCASKLKSCGDSASMEEILYSRVIVQDCKNFNSYLKDQKTNAEANKRIAEAAVRKARLEMLDTTNRYNRGECLLAYRSCISDKGGCGANFENCLDAELLGRRANACDNVLDQCMAVKTDVLKDWKSESEMILTEAAKYVDQNRRLTCMAKIQACLEDGCSTSTESACLTNVNVAAGICPIIDECNEMVPGIKSSVNDKLGYLRNQFCQNDIDKCLQDKCGANYTAPECVGKTTSAILAMCPQSSFPSCARESASQFAIITQAALLQMDYQMMQGCVNYFGTQLNAVCGTDMSCLPTDTLIVALKEAPETQEEVTALREQVRQNSKKAVADFFVQFEKDITVTACSDAKKPAGKKSLGQNVFNSAKLIAEISAENRAMRELDRKLSSLERVASLREAEAKCYNDYAVETPTEGKKSYSYISSVAFEPSLSNCHVCRKQQVCETGGETKGSAGLKGAAGGLTAGAAAGTMVTPGWGTAIGGVVGAVGGLFAGRSGAGQQEFCQEIESCEDINIQVITAQ
ncbi:hypothetical protein LJC18_00060 [Lachnospiraceae bacterium OttesenSCG-928-E19]|nr:hypothetical protein [Lachnospiraceae bacterium OttesenSCG-928-E19]